MLSHENDENAELRVAFDSNRQQMQTLTCHVFFIISKRNNLTKLKQAESNITSSHKSLFPTQTTKRSCVMFVSGGV